MDKYTISLTTTPAEADIYTLVQRLRAYNLAQVGHNDVQGLAIFIRDGQGQIKGGLDAKTYWGWLVIELLWVDEAVRGKGYGGQLLEMAEEEAKSRGCTQALVDTMSFQAPGFYQKHGYETFGVLEGFASHHQRIYLRKMLAR